jgi:hypothetical protein
MREKRDCTECAVGYMMYPKRGGETWVLILIFGVKVHLIVKELG